MVGRPMIISIGESMTLACKEMISCLFVNSLNIEICNETLPLHVMLGRCAKGVDTVSTCMVLIVYPKVCDMRLYKYVLI